MKPTKCGGERLRCPGYQPGLRLDFYSVFSQQSCRAGSLYRSGKVSRRPSAQVRCTHAALGQAVGSNTTGARVQRLRLMALTGT